MSQLLISYNRMFEEGERLGVLDDVLTIAACIKVGGINSRLPGDIHKWLSFVPTEKESDLLVQLKLFQIGQACQGSLELKEEGIYPRLFFEALKIRTSMAQELIEKAKVGKRWVEFSSSRDREKIIRACVAGMIRHLYHYVDGGINWNSDTRYQNGNGEIRYLSRMSVLSGRPPFWVVAVPLDIKPRNGNHHFNGDPKILPLVTLATKVDPELIKKIAPNLVKRELTNWRQGSDGVVKFNQVERLNGVLISSESLEAPWKEAQRLLPDETAKEAARKELILYLFRMASHPRGPLKPEPMRNKFDPATLHPKAFGVDPENGEQLFAYPAVLRNDSSPTRWEICYFLIQEEAQTAQNQFDEMYYSEAEEGKAEEGKWSHLEKRWWRCPSGHSVKAGKETSTVHCEFCGAIHKIS